MDRSTHLRLVGGSAVEVEGVATRFLCKGCGRTFTSRSSEAEAEECAVRDKAAELAFALGRAPAASELGIGTATLGTLLTRWHAAHEDEIGDASPDFLLVDRVHHRNREIILVSDVDRETLVDLIRGTDELYGWLSSRGRMPALKVAVPIEPGIVAAVRKSLPKATVMVPPTTVMRAIVKALAAGLRHLKGDPGMRGRNAMPGTAGFIRAVRGQVPPHDGWPREVLALVAAGRAAVAIAAAPDAGRGRIIWPEFELAASVSGAGPLARLMATWRDAILSGLDHRFVDGIAAAMERFRRTIQARRPSIVFEDLRGLILFGCPGHIEGWRRAPGIPGQVASRGRSIAGLAEMLSPGGM